MYIAGYSNGGSRLSGVPRVPLHSITAPSKDRFPPICDALATWGPTSPNKLGTRSSLPSSSAERGLNPVIRSQGNEPPNIPFSRPHSPSLRVRRDQEPDRGRWSTKHYGMVGKMVEEVSVTRITWCQNSGRVTKTGLDVWIRSDVYPESLFPDEH